MQIFITYFFRNTEKLTNLQENVDQDLLSSMKAGPHIVPSSVAMRKDEVQDGIPKIAPKWLKYDRQVSYLIHSFHDSPGQHFLGIFNCIPIYFNYIIFEHLN